VPTWPSRAFTSGLPAFGLPLELPDITTAPYGDLRRRDLHPLVKQLASLRSLHRHYPVSQVLWTSPPPHAARPIPHGRPVEGHAPSPHGLPVLRSISVYRHAVVNTPVARWALIARGTAYSNRFPVPSGCGLPHIHARSATTLDFSRPAQRSLAITACRLAESPKRPVCLEGSDGFVTSTAAPIATGWSDPVAGWELHPLKTNT
jgi:hypothetical protein